MPILLPTAQESMMVYREFNLERELPIHQVDWSHELRQLRLTTMDAVSLGLTLSGYLWAVIQWFLIHPDFAWSAMSLPLSVGCLGLLTLLLRQMTGLRTVLFVAGSVAVAAGALYLQRTPYAPYIAVAAVGAASLVAHSSAAFATAALATGALLGAATHMPGQWPANIVSSALVLYWTMAAVAWLTSRDLYTVLTWALQGYETSWRTMRQLQAQTGKLNQAMRSLAVANALLKRTTHDLAEAREEAEQARALKSQFAANISHELRTPLHIIVGFSQMMCTSPDSYRGVTWTPELRGDIQEVYENASHLLRLIDDVLDLSRLESVRMPLTKERVDLVALIRDAVETAAGLLRGRSLALRVDLPESLPAVFADPTRVRQVILNLLNNAARFTDAGQITVRASQVRDDIEIVVADTGVGVPADQLPFVFAEFYQVDGTLRRKHGGTGLGLAICKHFVSLHGGRIWAESEVGKGSAFHFTLPLPSKEWVPIQASQPPEGWLHPAARTSRDRIVVTLSRPPEFVRLVQRYLPSARVLAASDAEAAARMARARQADAIVIATGPESATEAATLAQATADLGLPVIACSLAQERQLAVAQGFSHSLAKPFTSQQLAETVAAAAPNATRVLVADDDPGVVRLAERCLKALLPGVTVLKAYDGDRAIALLAQRPDLVLLDLVLPGTDGLGVLKALRSEPSTASLPVVAITAHDLLRRDGEEGSGEICVRRGKQFAGAEITRWLETVLQTFPARHLSVEGSALEPALAPSG